METLVIMNYATGQVDVYYLSPDKDVDSNMLEELGYNPDEISWMFGEDINITVHSEIIK